MAERPMVEGGERKSPPVWKDLIPAKAKDVPDMSPFVSTPEHARFAACC
jgi:hypothetical protein